ncbi:MAG: site-specific integrase [Nitrososphaerota archaeon]|nr:site-specific integrase [Nitrososphaerota archaeon]
MSSKYSSLLEDQDVKRWIDNLSANSLITAEVYLRTMGLYCDLLGTTPKKILKDAPSKRFRDGFTDFVRKMEKEGKAGSYIERFKKVILSWLSYNNVEVKLKVNIRGKSETPTIANERVPSKDELSRILRMASPRARVSIALMAFSGLRPESLGSFAGTNAIKLQDFIEGKITSDGLSFDNKNIPSILRVRSPLSKARHQYFTFVGEEAITYINEYLQERAKKHKEKLSPTSPVLAFDPRGVKKTNPLLRTSLVTRDIKEAIIKAGFSWRPYVLRSYADTNMIVAESKGLISHPFLQFVMGHKGDIEARYSTNKGRLPPSMIEEMRKSYKKCEPILSTKSSEMGKEEIKQTVKEEFLSLAGIPEEQIENMDVASMSKEEVLKTVRDKLLGSMVNNGNKQRVVPIGEVKSFIGQGFEYVASLPDGDAIIRIPF